MRWPWAAAPGWWIGAQCRTEAVPLATFFDKEQSGTARKVCYRCPVRYRCLGEHLTESFGVWGGHSRDERERIRLAIEEGTTMIDASAKIDSRRLHRGPSTIGH